MIGGFKTAVSGPPGRRGVRVIDDAIGAGSQESARHARGVSIAASKLLDSLLASVNGAVASKVPVASPVVGIAGHGRVRREVARR